MINPMICAIQWFFRGHDNPRQAPADPVFYELVKTRILKVMDEMNYFMDIHYSAHGMKCCLQKQRFGVRFI